MEINSEIKELAKSLNEYCTKAEVFYATTNQKMDFVMEKVSEIEEKIEEHEQQSRKLMVNQAVMKFVSKNWWRILAALGGLITLGGEGALMLEKLKFLK